MGNCCKGPEYPTITRNKSAKAPSHPPFVPQKPGPRQSPGPGKQVTGPAYCTGPPAPTLLHAISLSKKPEQLDENTNRSSSSSSGGGSSRRPMENAVPDKAEGSAKESVTKSSSLICTTTSDGSGSSFSFDTSIYSTSVNPEQAKGHRRKHRRKTLPAPEHNVHQKSMHEKMKIASPTSGKKGEAKSSMQHKPKEHEKHNEKRGQDGEPERPRQKQDQVKNTALARQKEKMPISHAISKAHLRRRNPITSPIGSSGLTQPATVRLGTRKAPSLPPGTKKPQSLPRGTKKPQSSPRDTKKPQSLRRGSQDTGLESESDSKPPATPGTGTTDPASRPSKHGKAKGRKHTTRFTKVSESMSSIDDDSSEDSGTVNVQMPNWGNTCLTCVLCDPSVGNSF